MASFLVTHSQLKTNVAVLQTLTPNSLDVGDTITVAGVGAPFNGNWTVTSVSDHLFRYVDKSGDYVFDTSTVIPNQVFFSCTGTDQDRGPASGTITWNWPTCTWITSNDVKTWLGIDPASSTDAAFVQVCTDAANALAYRRRRESGYYDSATVVPGGDAFLGTTMWAASLYRERGSLDSFQSYDSMAATAPTASMGQIYRLLGCNRPQVA